VIGNITVKDSEKWGKYCSLVPLRTQPADVDLMTFEAD